MNDGFLIELWSAYFVATAGIGAALAGLVLVALAMHLRGILAAPGMVGRGAEALVLLVSPAFVAVAGLWPLDTAARVGIAIAGVGVVVWAIVSSIELSSLRGPRGGGRGGWLGRVVMGQVGTIPIILAGVSLAAGVGLGLDYLPVGALLALAGGLAGAWMVLVETLR
jgi:hypothetical protein